HDQRCLPERPVPPPARAPLALPEAAGWPNPPTIRIEQATGAAAPAARTTFATPAGSARTAWTVGAIRAAARTIRAARTVQATRTARVCVIPTGQRGRRVLDQPGARPIVSRAPAVPRAAARIAAITIAPGTVRPAAVRIAGRSPSAVLTQPAADAPGESVLS